MKYEMAIIFLTKTADENVGLSYQTPTANL